MWTMRAGISRFDPGGGMWRFASDDVVKVFVWTMRGGVWRFAPDDFVKVLGGRCGVVCGGLLQTIS